MVSNNLEIIDPLYMSYKSLVHVMKSVMSWKQNLMKQ